MKPQYLLLAVSLFGLAGCSTTLQSGERKADSETVLIKYHVRSGKEEEFQGLLLHAWGIYRSDGLVYASPHVIVRDTEDGYKTYFTEVFTWIKSPDHPSADVEAVWNQEQSLCEPRDGHRGIEGGKVELVTGK